MKKGFGKGCCSGILVAALTVGLGVSAMAASRTITVDDNIRITLNGAVFSPKDAKGRDVPLFSYNGTTYAPVRAICEAAGLKVDFDSANYTAVLTTPDRYIASTPSASNYISVDKAKEIALNHAGVKAADAIFVKAGLDWDDGRTEYEVEFYAGNTEYDYSIDATTGAIRSYDHDWDDFSLWNPGNNAANPSTPGTSTNNLISEAKAKEIALKNAGVTAGSLIGYAIELDTENGVMVYEVEFKAGGYEYDYDIDAKTGKILKRQKERDDDRISAAGTAALIGSAKAKEIALSHAAVSADGLRDVAVDLDDKDGAPVYEVEFKAGGYAYDYDIDAKTGKILKNEKEQDD